MRGGWVGIAGDLDEGLRRRDGGRGSVVGVAAAIGGSRRRRSMDVRIIERQGGHSRGRDESGPMTTGQRSVLMPVGTVVGNVVIGSSDGSNGREDCHRSKSHDGCGRSLHFFFRFGGSDLYVLVYLCSVWQLFVHRKN